MSAVTSGTLSRALVESCALQLVVFARAIRLSIFERVDSEDAARRVPCREEPLRFRVFESVDVEHIARRIEVPSRYARAVDDHLVERFAHRDRGARRVIELAERVRAVVDVAEHPEFRHGVPDAAVSAHPGLAVERPGIVDRKKLGHRLVSSPVEPASLLIGPRETGPGRAQGRRGRGVDRSAVRTGSRSLRPPLGSARIYRSSSDVDSITDVTIISQPDSTCTETDCPEAPTHDSGMLQNGGNIAATSRS